MKNPNARFITTPAPADNILPFVKTCASCVFAEPSPTNPASEIVCEVWSLRLKIEHGCTAFMADREDYYRFWRDAGETSLHPSAEKDVEPIINAVNVELQTESALRGDRAFGVPLYPYRNRRLERWEN